MVEVHAANLQTLREAALEDDLVLGSAGDEVASLVGKEDGLPLFAILHRKDDASLLVSSVWTAHANHQSGRHRAIRVRRQSGRSIMNAFVERGDLIEAFVKVFFFGHLDAQGIDVPVDFRKLAKCIFYRVQGATFLYFSSAPLTNCIGELVVGRTILLLCDVGGGLELSN